MVSEKSALVGLDTKLKRTIMNFLVKKRMKFSDGHADLLIHLDGTDSFRCDALKIVSDERIY